MSSLMGNLMGNLTGKRQPESLSHLSPPRKGRESGKGSRGNSHRDGKWEFDGKQTLELSLAPIAPARAFEPQEADHA